MNEEMVFREKLGIAASSKAEYIAPSLFQLIGYRQRIAEEILRGNPQEESFQMLKDNFDFIQGQIRTVLGL